MQTIATKIKIKEKQKRKQNKFNKLWKKINESGSIVASDNRQEKTKKSVYRKYR